MTYQDRYREAFSRVNFFLKLAIVGFGIVFLSSLIACITIFFIINIWCGLGMTFMLSLLILLIIGLEIEINS